MKNSLNMEIVDAHLDMMTENEVTFEEILVVPLLAMLSLSSSSSSIWQSFLVVVVVVVAVV